MANKLLAVVGPGISLASGVSALALPPPAFGLLIEPWNDATQGAVPEFELEMWADGDRVLTDATLYGAHSHALVIVDDTFTAAATNICTNATHGRLTGDGPVRLTNAGGALPAGLELAHDYWFIRLDDNTFSFAESRALALAGTAVDITGTGTGTHTYSDTTDTERVHWHTHGLLGLLEDGAIDLTNQQSYMVRCKHTPRAFAYAITATFGAGAGLVSAQIFPSLEI